MRSPWPAFPTLGPEYSRIAFRTYRPDLAGGGGHRLPPHGSPMSPRSVPMSGTSLGLVEAASVLSSDRGCGPEGFSLSHSP